MPSTRGAQARQSVEPDPPKRTRRGSSQQPTGPSSDVDHTTQDAKPVRPKTKKRRNSETPQEGVQATPKRRKTRAEPRHSAVDGLAVDASKNTRELEVIDENESPLQSPPHSTQTFVEVSIPVDAVATCGDESAVSSQDAKISQEDLDKTLPNSSAFDNHDIFTAVSSSDVQQVPSPPPPTNSPWLSRIFGSARRSRAPGDARPAEPTTKHVASYPSPVISSGSPPAAASASSSWLPHLRPMAKVTEIQAHSSLNEHAPITPVSELRMEHVRGSSLPPALLQNHLTTSPGLRDVHFAPLRSVLDDRIRRRLQAVQGTKGKKISRHSILEGDDEDMLVLDSLIEGVDVPRPLTREIPTSLTSSVDMQELSQRTIQEIEHETLHAAQKSWDSERRRFEEAIISLGRDANDAKAQLQILKIELQSLGFGDSSSSPKVVIESVRESISRVRELLLHIAPSSTAESVSTQEMMDLMIAKVREMTDDSQRQASDVTGKTLLIEDLSRQIQALLDHLAELEIRRATLQQQWRELDETNDGQGREIEDLEENIATLGDEKRSLAVQLQDKTAQIEALNEENLTLMQSLERLTDSLQDYRAEEKRLNELIARMESEHQNQTTDMQGEHEIEIKKLQVQMHSTEESLQDVRLKLEEHVTLIGKLEEKAAGLSDERDALCENLLREQGENEQEAKMRMELERDLEGKSSEIQSLTDRVSRLEEEMHDLSAQIIDLREHVARERRQREAAEADLDQRNADIVVLNQKLQSQGTQANELRQKLFEVQQQHASKLQELESTLADRDEQFQEDVAQEISRRESAVTLAQQRANTILDLETRVEEIELQMQTGLQERERQISELEAIIAVRNSEISSFREQIESAASDHARALKEEKKHGDDLEAIIVSLEESISRHETTIDDLEGQAMTAAKNHEAELEGQTLAIADLNSTITALRYDVEILRKERSGLESRVEAEAEHMLQFQNESADEIAGLKLAILDRQEKIRNVEEKAIEADQRWQEVLNARDEEIVELRGVAQESMEETTVLTSELESLKETFAQYIQNTNQVVAKLQDAVASAKAVADGEAMTHGMAGDAMLARLASIDIAGLIATKKSINKTTQLTSTVASSGQIQSPRKARAKGGRRSNKREAGALSGEAMEDN